MDESRPVQTAEALETVDALRPQGLALAAVRGALRASVVLGVAEARMCRDWATMIASRLHFSLKHGGEYAYSGTRDEKRVLNQTRRLGF